MTQSTVKVKVTSPWKLEFLSFSKSSYPAVAGLRLVGDTRLCHCAFTDRLLQYCSCWCTKDSHGQATVCVERGCAHHQQHPEVWLRSGSDTAWRASLAWLPWSGVLQVGSDSFPASEWPRSTVPGGLLCPGRRCWHWWLLGLFNCRPHNLELSPGYYPGPDCLCRLFQTSV